jgi:transcriptional regulator with XRE-family HTH domain
MVAITRAQFTRILGERIQLHGGYAKAAKALGVGRSTLEQVYNGHRDPGEALLTALGYRKRIVYEPLELVK